ncbi:MAG: hypothetical protein ABW123_27875 [Cystobacter sp.]
MTTKKLKLVCSACNAVISTSATGCDPGGDLHDCPFSVQPLPGESFATYKARADKVASERKASEPTVFNSYPEAHAAATKSGGRIRMISKLGERPERYVVVPLGTMAGLRGAP